MAPGIQKVDGVVTDTLHNRSKLLISVQCGLLRRALFADVPHKPITGTRCSLDGFKHDVHWKLGTVLAQPQKVQIRAH